MESDVEMVDPHPDGMEGLGEDDDLMDYVDEILDSQDPATIAKVSTLGKGSQSQPAKVNQATHLPGPEAENELDVHWDNSGPLPHYTIEINCPEVQSRSTYKPEKSDPRIKEIVCEVELDDQTGYKVLRRDNTTEKISLAEVFTRDGGQAALEQFERVSSTIQTPESEVVVTRRSVRRLTDTKVIALSDDSSDDLVSASEPVPRRRGRPSVRTSARYSIARGWRDSPRDGWMSLTSGSADRFPSRNSRGRRPTRMSTRDQVRYKEVPPSSSEDFLSNDSDEVMHSRKRKRGRPAKVAVRRSERRGRNLDSMQEIGENDIPDAFSRTSSKHSKPVVAKEMFRLLSQEDQFRPRHCPSCDVCGQHDPSDRGRLIFCQGCSMSYHQGCIGSQNSREHLTTKINNEEYVLQCRRCIEFVIQKERTAPHQGTCVECNQPGPACKPFRKRRNPREEQKEREENGGQDRVQLVPANLVNNPDNVLFRCASCYQAFHFHHLLPKSTNTFESSGETRNANNRFAEYSYDWTCHDCNRAAQSGEIGGLVAWRPLDPNKYTQSTKLEAVPEDEKEYLVKWRNRSYYKCIWMRGSWVWGVAAPAMRAAFARRDESLHPKLRTEDAISEDYLRVDIVFDVKYNSVVNVQIEEVDLARVKEVEKARVKYKGLGYEDVVWEEPPDPEDTERWEDFVSAYSDWVRGHYIHSPQPGRLDEKIRSLRNKSFDAKVSLKEQPDSLTGGKLMDYQLQGINWTLYKYHQRKNVILADEMGLGKTIQIIGFFTTLQQAHGIWPFLVVVPNSTCANWRREIKQWAPSLRVVTYFGSAAAREIAAKHELFPHKNHKRPNDLACHVVVTSYDAAQDDSANQYLKKISWAAMVVDEGQRLKNDQNMLYAALSKIKNPFRLLLTGTPLQNHVRELLNLLQFLNGDIDAAKLEEEYADLGEENIPKLQNLLRPHILRRTKADVLSFLPPMGETIIPVSMSSLQKELYKGILEKNIEDLKSIFAPGANVRQSATKNLRNVLSQLRKCLCHPFVYNSEVEERSLDSVVSHRRLVAAASKLQFLDITLPKLHERGHRVLIFSQFLDMLTIMEDFLDGLGLQHGRLDGTLSSLEKQKVIDRFNAEGSDQFALLLSTRAGGVGINLATADTVIVMDPDFNPHQDIQAISRAHRIGQKNKVLVLRLVTRLSAEEKIVQMGKKKIAMDHVLVEKLEDQDADVGDLVSVLRHGAEALFNDDGSHDIHYTSEQVDAILDRSKIEATKPAKDGSGQSQFSFARIWVNDAAAYKENALEQASQEGQLSADTWERILQYRKQKHEAECLAAEQKLGRGKRTKQAVNYGTGKEPMSMDVDNEEDSDFEGQVVTPSSSSDDSADEQEPINTADLQPPAAPPQQRAGHSLTVDSGQQPQRSTGPFRRAVLTPPSQLPQPNEWENPCLACDWRFGRHAQGWCPLKTTGPEHCNLCGFAHFGSNTGRRNCAQMQSEQQVSLMLQLLNSSPEPPHLVERAKQILRGIKSDLVRKKREKELEGKQTTKPTTKPAQGSASVQPEAPSYSSKPWPQLGYFEQFRNAAPIQGGQHSQSNTDTPPKVAGSVMRQDPSTNGAAQNFSGS